MRVGLVDCDTATLKRGNKAFFPNLALMKISAWHKQQGDTVEWYRDKMINGHVDKIYVSKVFSFSEVPDWDFDADEIEYGGSGFAISVVGGSRYTTQTRTRSSHMRLNTSIQTTSCTSISRRPTIQHMASCSAAVPAIAVSATYQRCKARKL